MVEVKDILKILSEIKMNSMGPDVITLQMLNLCFPALGDFYIVHIINYCSIEVVFSHLGMNLW